MKGDTTMNEQTFELSTDIDLDKLDDWLDATWPGRSCSTYVRDGLTLHIDATIATTFYAKWSRQCRWLQPEYLGEEEAA